MTINPDAYDRRWTRTELLFKELGDANGGISSEYRSSRLVRNIDSSELLDAPETDLTLRRASSLRALKSHLKRIRSVFGDRRQNGKPIGEFRKSWARVCVSAGLGKMVCPKCGNEGKTNTCSTCKNVTLYSGRIFRDFRRTAVRNMIRAGVPEPVAMAISGHKTGATFDRYNIVNEEDLRRAMERTEAYLKVAPKQSVSVFRNKKAAAK